LCALVGPIKNLIHNIILKFWMEETVWNIGCRKDDKFELILKKWH
jgi:hypothetical protein